ncbi:MAG: phosphatase PAP2 family protein [Pseudomonadota bacterium]
MDAVKNFIKMVMPLALLGSALILLSAIFAGKLSIGVVTFPQIYFLFKFVACFLLILSLLFIVESLKASNRFVNQETKQLDIGALWQSLSMKSAMLTGGGVMALVILSINGNSNLIEIYRTSTTVWRDNLLWDIEEPLFRALIASDFLFLKFWECVYYLMWVYVLLVMAALVKKDRAESYMTFAIAIVLAFYCTTLVAMFFPVAGPEYYRPELFAYLKGSTSKHLQDLLRDYQMGRIPQNGLFYGMMAMPSLHVALTAMATWFVARHWRPALWCAIPSAVLIWISTVVLAWHYALDGVAALAMAFLCVVIANKIVKFSRRLTGGPLDAGQL